jgi:hypothetical protein
MKNLTEIINEIKKENDKDEKVKLLLDIVKIQQEKIEDLDRRLRSVESHFICYR